MKTTLPNQLSVFRIMAAPFFGWMALSSSDALRVGSIGLFFIAVLTDFYDGYHARKYNAVSKVGAFLDPLADKFLIGTGFFVLSVYGILELWMVIIVIARDILVTGLRIYAKLNKCTMETSFSAKMKTFLQCTFLYSILMVWVFQSSDFFSQEIRRLATDIISSEWVYRIMLALTIISVYTSVSYTIETISRVSKSKASASI